VEEVWKDVPGFEGKYQASDLGRVKSIKRNRERILAQHIDKLGYPRLTLWWKGKLESKRVHGLVTEAFFGARPGGLTVNHKDGDKTNNRLSNLEYLTLSENIKHAFRLGLKGKGEEHPRAKLTSEQVKDICARRGAVSQSKLAELYGVTKTCIRHVQLGRNWSSVTGIKRGTRANTQEA
jgi:hypothetical protein